MRYSGPPSHNESDNLSVARTLLSVLNHNGEDWGPPSKPPGSDRGVDMEAFGPLGHLEMQITRVPTNQEFWRSLNQTGHADRFVVATAAADHLMDAVREKAVRVPLMDRATLTLVLDATKSPEFEFPEARQLFFEKHSAAATSFGFADVLMVGVARVDSLLTAPESGNSWFRFG